MENLVLQDSITNITATEGFDTNTYTNSNLVSISGIGFNNCTQNASTDVLPSNELIDKYKAEYKAEICAVIKDDCFEDGTITKSEVYIHMSCTPATCGLIKAAIMDLYLANLNDPHMLEGLLVMIENIPYEIAEPECPIMAFGLLSNTNDDVRVKAIKTFSHWNSKKTIPYLQSLRCDQTYLQKYVGKIIKYLERDGTA